MNRISRTRLIIIMEIKQASYTRRVLAVAVMVFAVTRLALAGDSTAFDLVKLGDQYVGVQSKDKVVQIRSEKSVASLTPDIWYVVYYDPDATFKAVEVKFGAGQKMDVSHPGRFLELFGRDKETLDAARLKIDSDQAARIAAAQLGKQLVVARKQAEIHMRAAGRFKARQRMFADIGIPGVEIEARFLRMVTPGKAGKADPCGCGAKPRQNTPA